MSPAVVIAAALPSGSMFHSVHAVFHSTAFLLTRDLAIGMALLFWLALGYWVYKDARRRIDDPWLVATATALGLVPPYLGPLVYMLFRPPETLAELRSRSAELHLFEHHLASAAPSCPACGAPARDGYLVCPVCARRLRHACGACSAPLEPEWRTCPYCAEPTAAGEGAAAVLSADPAGAAAGPPGRVNGNRAVQRSASGVG